jgi:hypothetical protein
MSFWEFFAVVASAASIISLAIAISSIFNGRATRRVVREINTGMEERLTRVLERMDQRADERHREVIQVIQTLRA